MTEHEIFQRTQAIFRDVFDDARLEISGETSAKDIEDWDSLNQINLIVAMEKEFKIKFDLAEVQRLPNVGGMLALIRHKVGSGTPA